MLRIALVLVVLAGCAAEGEPVRNWTLTVDDRTEPVTLPRYFLFALPLREAAYRLTTEVELEAGAPVTLVLECFHGDIALAVDGAPIPDVGDAAVGEHRFVIPAAFAHAGRVRLELAARNEALSLLAARPRLVPGVKIERGFIAAFNRSIALVVLGLVFVFGLLYGALYAYSRRSDDAAFLLTVGCAAFGPLWQLGVMRDMGWIAPVVLAAAVCGANAAVLHFVHASFSLGPPPRWLLWLFGLIAVASLTAPISLALATASKVASGTATAVFAMYLLVRLLRLARTRQSRDAKLFLVAAAGTGLVMLPDMLGFIIGYSVYDGLHVVPIGTAAFVVAQALVLARQHVARQRALERTAEELQRQVAERSRELAEALSQLASRGGDALTADRVIADRYRVIKKLGAGGMGAVYEVERTSDHARLALKTLRGQGDASIMARFAREAQIAAEISHANLVPVLDVGIADGALYLVMPLVAGGSLEQQRTRFGDAAWATPILAQIAAGLAALHAKGIVHRDLKPGNVLLGSDAIQIADFGLATLRAGTHDTAASSAALADTAAPLTRAGDLFGTPAYMAPELAGGVQDATPAVDMFAFGVLAYEMLTGKRPYAEPPVLAKLHGHPITTPSCEAIAEPVRDFVQRCLDGDPAKRPAASDWPDVRAGNIRR